MNSQNLQDPLGEVAEDLDLQKPQASLKTPKDPLVISIGSIVSHQLTEDGYTELSKQVSEFVRKILALSRSFSSLGTDDPSAQITGANVRTAIEVQRTQKPKRTAREAIWELSVAVALAALGMLIDVGLHAGEVSHTRDLVVISIVMVGSLAGMYYGHE